MVEKGHFEELQNLLELINADEEKKKKRQTFVFSATLTLIHELPKHMRNCHKAVPFGLTGVRELPLKELKDYLFLFFGGDHYLPAFYRQILICGIGH